MVDNAGENLLFLADSIDMVFGGGDPVLVALSELRAITRGGHARAASG
jgi:hypothetical protein